LESGREAAVALGEGTKAELIREYIVPSEYHPGPADVRIKGTGVPVWAVIGQYKAEGGDAQYVADGYRISLEALQAALAYYEENTAVIDARLAANEV
jgi:uncharacterized protein (DUF433 family)